MVTESEPSVERAALALVGRIEQSLGAPSLVLDETGIPLAGGPDATPETNGATRPTCWRSRVSVRLAGAPVEVLIGPLPDGTPLDERPARALVELLAADVSRAGGLPNHEEMTERLLLDLLHGGAVEGEIERRGEVLGVDLIRPRAAILVDAAAYILEVGGAADGDRGVRALTRARRVTAAIRRYLGPASEVVYGYVGEGEVVVLKARDDDEPAGTRADVEPGWDGLIPLKRAADELLRMLRRETGAEIAVGAGRYHDGPAGLVRSYEDARAAIRLGRRFGQLDRTLTLDALGIEALAGGGDVATRASLAARLLAPLLREPELMETIEAYFAEDCQPTPTARRLAIHRNTLAYRLEKVAALTGLDPRRFSDAIRLRLALILHALRSDPIPLCGRPTGGGSRGPTLAPRPMRRAAGTS